MRACVRLPAYLPTCLLAYIVKPPKYRNHQ